MLSSHLAGSDFAPPGDGKKHPARQENRFRNNNLSGSRPEANQAASFRRSPPDQAGFEPRERRLPPPRRDGRPPRPNEHRSESGRADPGKPDPRKAEFRPPPPEQEGLPPPQNKSRAPAPPEYRVSYALLDRDKKYVVGNYPQNREYVYTDIPLAEETVGFLAVSKRNELTKEIGRASCRERV